MGIGPSIAIPKVLEKVGLTKEDVDLFEVCMNTNGPCGRGRDTLVIVDQRSLRFHVRLLRAQARTRSGKGQRERRGYSPWPSLR
jgi:hypothetical protein